jgi:hypothetical protein
MGGCCRDDESEQQERAEGAAGGQVRIPTIMIAESDRS